ncbi:MAG TPA: response regulator [Myxococcales bacterium]|nr:response regulator [Myxococcales bacterium]
MSLVLIVEDSPGLLEVYTYILEQRGHRVLTARDGLEGLALAHRWRPDLVITDWQLPRLDGVEMSKRMRRSPDLRSIPILLLSSSPDPHCPWVSLFLSKNASFDELERGIARLIARSEAEEIEPCRMAL